MKIAGLVAALLAGAAAGCVGADAVYRGLYHGLQVREELVNPAPGYHPAERRPGYEEYQAERQRRLPRAD